MDIFSYNGAVLSFFILANIYFALLFLFFSSDFYISSSSSSKSSSLPISYKILPPSPAPMSVCASKYGNTIPSLSFRCFSVSPKLKVLSGCSSPSPCSASGFLNMGWSVSRPSLPNLDFVAAEPGMRMNFSSTARPLLLRSSMLMTTPTWSSDLPFSARPMRMPSRCSLRPHSGSTTLLLRAF